MLAIYFFFFLVEETESKSKAMEAYRDGTVFGGLILGACVHGAEVFLAMQGRQHILTALIWAKCHSAMAVSISSSLSPPSMLPKR